EIHHKDKNLEFLIIGDGPLEKLLIHNQDSIPITYFPNFPYSKMEDVYNMSKILVMTSRFEGLPTTLLESLSCETPVLTSNVGGISELIQTNRNGFFINIEENNNTAEKILDLVSDDDKIRKMGQKGRSIIENDFSWKIISKKIIKIYEEVLS
ncbi:MAG: glycosyltransferase family 4 protein, partial [Candidatus Lokiarchaeota archaeon]